MQMNMERTKIPAVVSGADADDAGTAGSLDAGARGLLDRGEVESVDDDFIDGVDAFGKGGCDEATQRGAIGVVGAGLELFVAAADLAAAADDAAGKGTNDSGHSPDGGDGGFSRGEGNRLTFAEDQEVAAGYSFDRAEHIFTEELAVHDRHAPEAPAIELLADLETVAEETQIAADADVLVLDRRQPVVACRGGAGEDTLADTVDSCFLQGVAAECEQEQAHAGPAVRRLFRR